MRSSARWRPTERSRYQVEPPSGVSPIPVYAITNFADSPATTRSDAGDEREPGACRAPLHRGDDGDVDRGEPVDRDVEPLDDLGEPGIEIGTGVGERPDVSTAAEPSTGTGHEHRAEVVAAPELLGDLGERAGELEVDRVRGVGAVELEARDAVRDREDDRWLAHRHRGWAARRTCPLYHRGRVVPRFRRSHHVGRRERPRPATLASRLPSSTRTTEVEGQMRRVVDRTRRRGVATSLALALSASALVALIGTADASAAPNTDQLDPKSFGNPATGASKWFPLVPGNQTVKSGHVNKGHRELRHRVVTTVTDVTKVIDGVRAVAVLDQDFDGGEIG